MVLLNTLRKVISTEEAEEFARVHGLDFYETSAKTGFNVEKVFNNLGFAFNNPSQLFIDSAQKILENIDKGLIDTSNEVKKCKFPSKFEKRPKE